MKKIISIILAMAMIVIPTFGVTANEPVSINTTSGDNNNDIYYDYLLSDYADRFAGKPDKQQEFLQAVTQKEEAGITVDTSVLDEIYIDLSGISDPNTPHIIEQASLESSAIAEAEIIKLDETQAEIMQAGITVSSDDSEEVVNNWLGPVKVCVNKAYYHSLILNGDGSVWSSGNNLYGQLGNGTTTNSTTPVRVKDTDGDGYLTNIIDIAAGSYQSFALTSNGTVVGWGANGVCKIGNDSTTEYFTLPTYVHQAEAVVNLHLYSVVAISSGNNHCMALKEDGTVWTWGYNTYKQLGHSINHNHSSYAQQVKGENGVGYLTDVVAVSAGGNHCLALKEDGTVWSWGYNNKGQLGDNTYTTSQYPTQVRGIYGTDYLSNIVAISAGEFYNLALSADGRVYGWGDSYYSQLGNGEYTLDFRTPILVKGENGIGYLENVRSIAAGSCMSTFVKNDGTTYVCGCNDGGIIGTGTVGHRPYPTPLGLNNLSYVSGGFFNTLAIDQDGKVWAWGNNQDGAFGIGSSGNIATTPVRAYTLETLYDDYNDDFIEAAIIPQNAIVYGKINRWDDMDYFKFTSNTSGEFIIEKNCGNEAFIMQLCDSSNKVITPLLNVYRLNEGETYYIRIYNNGTLPFYDEYTYDFKITPFAGAELDELDVNVKYFNDNYKSEAFLWGRHSLEAKIDLTNTSSVSKDIDAALILYNAQNEIADVMSQNVILAAGQDEEVTLGITLPKIVEGYYMRTMIWDKASSEHPHIVTSVSKYGTDTFGSIAVNIEPEERLSGRLNTSVDVDTFAFTPLLTSNPLYSVRTTGNVTAEVCDSNGTPIAQSGYGSYSLTAGNTYKIRIFGNEGLYTFAVVPSIQTLQNTVTLDNCAEGEYYDVAIRLDSISNINAKQITITYDNTALEVCDLCTFSKTDSISEGTISGTDFKAANIENGEIVLEIDREIGENTWSGTATVLKFKAKANGSTNITTKIENR